MKSSDSKLRRKRENVDKREFLYHIMPNRFLIEKLENSNLPFRKGNSITRNDQKSDQSCRLRDPVPGTGSTRTFRSPTGMSWYEKSGILALRDPWNEC